MKIIFNFLSVVVVIIACGIGFGWLARISIILAMLPIAFVAFLVLWGTRNR